jgi:hypothetical protein
MKLLATLIRRVLSIFSLLYFVEPYVGAPKFSTFLCFSIEYIYIYFLSYFSIKYATFLLNI